MTPENFLRAAAASGFVYSWRGGPLIRITAARSWPRAHAPVVRSSLRRSNAPRFTTERSRASSPAVLSHPPSDHPRSLEPSRHSKGPTPRFDRRSRLVLADIAERHLKTARQCSRSRLVSLSAPRTSGRRKRGSYGNTVAAPSAGPSCSGGSGRSDARNDDARTRAPDPGVQWTALAPRGSLSRSTHSSPRRMRLPMG